jgi:hypothetical protein
MGAYIVACQTITWNPLVALFIFLMWLVWGFCYVKHVEIIYSDHLVGLKNGDFLYDILYIAFF